jgi:hypothetical protein
VSDKQKKFVPSTGYIVAVHQNALGIRAVAEKLEIFPEELAEALEEAGFQLMADPFDLSADAGKLIKLQERQKTEGIRLVKEQPDDSGSDTSTD